ncbi:hypothetical protein CBG25_14175, partial [Arsenophonus sp. ENCA]|uniref:hypothetical protein n=1 Tax=Arsenophonus sp. ENCA TaxID=1987579 RepID=UPI000BD912E3
VDPLLMIPSYSLAQVFGISISEQRKIYFNHRNTLISLLSNTLIEIGTVGIGILYPHMAKNTVQHTCDN